MTLLRRWAAGDKLAGGELFDRHYGVLARFFGNKAPNAAEDLIQSVFLACLEQPERFNGYSSFRTYLLGIARFKLYAHFRSGKGRTRPMRFNTTSAFCRATSPSLAVARHDENRNLLRALSAIPLDQQMILELAYWEELRGAELAEVLDVPLNTVYSRLHRAKRALRDALRLVERGEAPRS